MAMQRRSGCIANALQALRCTPDTCCAMAPCASSKHSMRWSSVTPHSCEPSGENARWLNAGMSVSIFMNGSRLAALNSSSDVRCLYFSSVAVASRRLVADSAMQVRWLGPPAVRILSGA